MDDDKDTDLHALRALAQRYFDAAYEMDVDQFASVLHPSSSVTRLDADGNVSVTPLTAWLATVRTIEAPKNLGHARRDEIVSIDIEGELAVLKLRLQVLPRQLTDVLSCLKVHGSWKIVQKVMRAT